MENLRLRDSGRISGNQVATIAKGETVTVLEEGMAETIDGLESAWARVETGTGMTGWVFGGYLGWTKRNGRVWAGMNPFPAPPEWTNWEYRED
jgi:hypothetical protein